MSKQFFTEVVLLTKAYNLQDIADWLYWHLDVVGFQHAHIFDNESLVDVKRACNIYGNRVSYETIRGWPNQYELYNQYVNFHSPAWWVFTIDDDEFLYVSDRYKNNVNNCLANITKCYPNRIKIAVGWRNLFPYHYTETRLNNHLILNSIGWSDSSSEIWQAGNRPVKTFVLTTNLYEWSTRITRATHDPLVNGIYNPAKTVDGKDVICGWQQTPTNSNADMILYHYQFKCNQEWVYKCIKRRSAASTIDWKNHPDLYRKLYTNQTIQLDERMKKLWETAIPIKPL